MMRTPISAEQHVKAYSLDAASEGSSESLAMYDLFVSAPLSGWGERDFATRNREVLDALDAIRLRHTTSIYFAGESLESWQNFEPSHTGAEADLLAIERSSRFLLWYPAKIVSSTESSSRFTS